MRFKSWKFEKFYNKLNLYLKKKRLTKIEDNKLKTTQFNYIKTTY